ncbi:hypothetical protein [uncultured Tateyamaria sp.]|uniref:hypothetical protein n=1 Tax=uncultured Tateyamaria sp. TaxID=455651 RepID=UPI002628314D|nr:hypothetical protein [uncultured Tateyamaria sp.]
MTQGSKSPGPDRIEAMLDDMSALPVPEPSPDLMARVLADAQAHLPAPGGGRPQARMWRQIIGGLGGWGAVGGLVAATATGFVIGLGALDTTGVDALWTLGYDADYDTDLGLDAFGWALEEG